MPEAHQYDAALLRTTQRVLRHCELSEAIQEIFYGFMDCFVALLLAMTPGGIESGEHARSAIVSPERI